MEFYLYIDGPGDGTVRDHIRLPAGTAAPTKSGLTARSVSERVYYTNVGAIRVLRTGQDVFPVTYVAATDTYTIGDFDDTDTRPTAAFQISANSGASWSLNNGQWYELPQNDTSPYRVRVVKLNSAGNAADTGFNSTVRLKIGITAEGRDRLVELRFTNGVSQAFTIDTSKPRVDRIGGSESFDVRQPLRYRVWAVDTWA